MADKMESYYVLDNFDAGDDLYVHRFDAPKLVVGRQRSNGSISKTKLGVAVEPIFAEGIGDGRSLIVMGPEIRLHDDATDRYGAVVGFVASFKADPRLKTKPKSAFRRRLNRMFEHDGPVVVVFMVVLLILGASIGAIGTLMIAG